MAQKDVKPIKTNYRGGSWGRSSNAYKIRSAGGRRSNDDLWERFERWFNRNPDDPDHLYTLDEQDCYNYVRNSTLRYRLYDICTIASPGYNTYTDGTISTDSRAHRLVIKHHSEAEWLKFHKFLVDNHNKIDDQIKKEQQERAEQREAEWQARIEQQQAERLKVDLADLKQAHNDVELAWGMFQSDLYEAFRPTDKVGASGDWIEDPVDILYGEQSNGWGYSAKKATGVKMQVTVSLDLSNSMYYNNVHWSATDAFRKLGFLLRKMANEFGDDFHVAFFTFSDDEWYDKDAGKRVRKLEPKFRPDNDAQKEIAEFLDFMPSRIDTWKERHGCPNMFGGTDTWFTPLFEQIEKWEEAKGDPNAARIDIILSDAVFEHPTDVRRSSEIQERRDGNLQSVILNFLPMEEIVHSTLPLRCRQVPVHGENVNGVLRSLISDFIASNSSNYGVG